MGWTWRELPRETGRRDRGRGETTGVLIVVGTVVAVAVVVVAAGVTSGSLWVFEALAAAGVLLGLGVAFGALDGRRARRRRWTSRGDAPGTAELSAQVRASLSTLDRVEHRLLDLGAPWPAVIVGPTGVHVVAVATSLAGAPVTRLRDVLRQARRLTCDPRPARPVTVRGLLVVPDDVAAEGPPIHDGVRTIAVRELVDVLSRGPLLPMATVAAVFAHLSGSLSPELHADVG